VEGEERRGGSSAGGTERALSLITFQVSKKNRFSSYHFSFIILSLPSADRLESGLVRLTRRGTSALSKRRMENLLFKDKWKMRNVKSFYRLSPTFGYD
jgi:hypothetical protein